MSVSGDREQASFHEWGTRLRAPESASGPGWWLGTRRRVLALTALGLACGVAGALAVVVTRSGSQSPRAIAAATNLRLSDLPGFRLSSNAGVSTSGDPGAEFQQCFGTVPNAAGAPSFDSPDLVSGGGLESVSVGSTVSFVTPAALQRDAAIARNPRFPQCFSDALAAIRMSANGVQITASNPTATTLPIPVSASASVDPVLGMRAAITWTADGNEIPVYVDVYLVGVGHDELSIFIASAENPVSASTEQRLVNLVVARALGQPHGAS